jgi:hypothetical protein
VVFRTRDHSAVYFSLSQGRLLYTVLNTLLGLPHHEEEQGALSEGCDNVHLYVAPPMSLAAQSK